MKDYGLVSIVTPSYNCAAFIGETIDSILAQTYQNWELIITDDCSTDNSREIIEKYSSQDSRIKLLKLNENSGAGVARNNSIKSSQGRFIAFAIATTVGILKNWKGNYLLWNQKIVRLVSLLMMSVMKTAKFVAMSNVFQNWISVKFYAIMV